MTEITVDSICYYNHNDDQESNIYSSKKDFRKSKNFEARISSQVNWKKNKSMK